MTLRLTCNPDRTRDTPEVCVYCHEVFRRPAAYITHQYKRHFRETDEIKVAFTKAIVQRLRDESESELNMALQASSSNVEKGERADSTLELSTKSLGDVPREQDSTLDAQSRLGTLAADTKGSVSNGCDRRSPAPKRTVAASPVAPGKRAWLDTVQIQDDAGDSRKKKCLESHRQGAAVFATRQTGLGAERAERFDQALASDGSPSEPSNNQHQCAPWEGNARTSGQEVENDLINRVTTAARASYPYTIEGKTATLKDEISRAILPEHAQKETALQELFQELSPQDIEDVHRTVLEKDVGLDRRDIRAVWQQVWDALQSSRAYILEEKLRLPRTSCIFVDIDTDGDLVVSVKIGRLKGMRLCADWKLLTHLRYM